MGVLVTGRQNLKPQPHFRTCWCGESAFEAPRLHLQRLGRSGRIHFLSAAAFFVVSWMDLFASSASVIGVPLSTLLATSILPVWGHTDPPAGVSLDEGTDGMAYPGKQRAVFHRHFIEFTMSPVVFVVCEWIFFETFKILCFWFVFNMFTFNMLVISLYSIKLVTT